MENFESYDDRLYAAKEALNAPVQALKNKMKQTISIKDKGNWHLSGEADAFVLIFIRSGNYKFG